MPGVAYTWLKITAADINGSSNVQDREDSLELQASVRESRLL